MATTTSALVSTSNTFLGLLAPKHDEMTLKLSSPVPTFYPDDHHNLNINNESQNVLPSSAEKENRLEDKTEMANTALVESGQNKPKQDTTMVIKSEPMVVEDYEEKKKQNIASSSLPATGDENSSSSCSQASSQQSSPNRKRRRPETQILVQDLMSMDREFAERLSTQNGTTEAKSSSTPTGATTPGGDEDKSKPTKSDSPAFRLRPRRSHRAPGGYCSSGSNSPIYLSPVKRSRPATKSGSFTNQLLKDTSRRLSDFYARESDPNSNQASCDTSNSSSTVAPKKVARVMPTRSVEKSIVKDIDISVFAEFVSPLLLKADTIYAEHYLSLAIETVRPMKTHKLCLGDKQTNAYLELICTDIDDRFRLQHTKGVFDCQQLDKDLSFDKSKKWQVYLVGAYARKSEPLVAPGTVINIARFRTAHTSPQQIIVDSPQDFVKKDVEDLGAEEDEFSQMYSNTKLAEPANDPGWAPLVSFTTKWRAPEDLNELNQSLYVFRPCIPKFEGTSKTVKM